MGKGLYQVFAFEKTEAVEVSEEQQQQKQEPALSGDDGTLSESDTKVHGTGDEGQ